MLISDFRDLISAIPFCQHSVDVKRTNWNNDNQVVLIQHIFGNNVVITLSRNDLFQTNGTTEFVIKTLMWGYPTGGRGSNINKLLEENNFQNLIELLDNYQSKNFILQQLISDINAINGLGISTMTKLIYFLNATIDNHRALILDNRIIDVLKDQKFQDPELQQFAGIKYENAITHYVNYLESMNLIASRLKVLPDQIELFLFLFGQNLSDVNCEKCFHPYKN